MSELMKVQITGEFADISVRVPAAELTASRQSLKISCRCLTAPPKEMKAARILLTEVFPEGIRPMDVLKGARYREGLTQAQLAAKVGVKATNISEMERGKRPIGKEMAKRLAKVLNTQYQVFL